MVNQGYASVCTRHFGFIEKFKLESYSDRYKPLIVFGCWNHQDIEVINNHKGEVYVRWDGGDARRYSGGIKRDFISIAHAPFIRQALLEKGISSCMEKRTTDKGPMPLRCGDKIYAYITKTAPELYGMNELLQVRTDRTIIYPNGTRKPGERFVLYAPVDKTSWDGGINDTYYGQVFVGLLLSKYVGGCITIEELGLRGIHVITNILDMPHCIPWKSIEDIEEKVRTLEQYIGYINNSLAMEVYESMVDIRDDKGYNFNRYTDIRR